MKWKRFEHERRVYEIRTRETENGGIEAAAFLDGRQVSRHRYSVSHEAKTDLGLGELLSIVEKDVKSGLNRA